MGSQSGTFTWKIVLGLLLITACIVVFLAWESKGRPGAFSKGKSPSDSDAAPAKMEVYHQLCRGKTLAGDGKHAEALAIFEELVRTEKGSRYGWDADIQAAASMGQLGRYEEALARFDRILASCPLEQEIPKARLEKANVHSMAGQHDTAVKILESLIMEYAEAQTLICEDALMGLVGVYTRTGQLGLVRAALDRIITDYPGAENLKRTWAQKRVTALREKLSELQKTKIDQLLTQDKARKVDKFDEGITTWRADDGPYLVTQQLVIGPSSRLQIEAGTQIRFGVLGGLRIEGGLEAAGTQEKPIDLSPLTDDPTKDFWAGLEFVKANGENTSQLRNCRLLGAEIAVQADQRRVEMDYCIFDRCGRVSILISRGAQLVMTDCQVTGGYRIGVECGPASVLQMTDCQINGLTTHGLVLKEVRNESFIRQSRIEQCAWDGVLIRGQCSPTIDNCLIRNNGANGIRATEGASPTVVNTRVENSAGVGIRLEERWDGVIRESIISGNRGGGIVADVRCNGRIVGNLVENNDKVGLCLRLDCTPLVTDNQFFKNMGPGLLIENSQPKELRNNQFLENTESALRNQGNSTVQAAQNWWGSTSENKIAEMIQDHQDNPEWGEVEFKPWLSQAPANIRKSTD